MNFVLTRTLPFFLILLASYILYSIYKVDIYKWFCHSEDNSASCYVVGLLLDDMGLPIESQEYFSLSCELDYGIGCFKMSNLLVDQNPEKSLELLEKACELNHEVSCEALR